MSDTDVRSEKKPPMAAFAGEYEMKLLGLFLSNQEAARRWVLKLEVSDFYFGANQQIFRLIRGLIEKNVPLNEESFFIAVDRDPMIEDDDKISVKMRARSMADGPCLEENAEQVIRMIRNLSFSRRITACCYDAITRAEREPDKPENWMPEFEDRLAKLTDQSSFAGEEVVNYSKALVNWATLRYRNVNTILKTGFPSIDRKIGGFNKGDMIVLAARPSVGKTTLALNILQNVALERKLPALFCSLEMSANSIMDRLASQITDKDASKLTGDDVTALLRTVVTDTSAVPLTKLVLTERVGRIDRLEHAARQADREMRVRTGEPLALIVVDYLQRMSLPLREASHNRNLDVGEIANRLKNLAMELNCPVLVLSQMSRNIDRAYLEGNALRKQGRQAADRLPVLSDLRDSGEIEAHADMVLFLHPEKAGVSSAEAAETRFGDEQMVKFIIEKNRNGPTGTVRLILNGRRFLFRDPAKKVKA